jgi:hypothetical protein
MIVKLRLREENVLQALTEARAVVRDYTIGVMVEIQASRAQLTIPH